MTESPGTTSHATTRSLSFARDMAEEASIRDMEEALPDMAPAMEVPDMDPLMEETVDLDMGPALILPLPLVMDALTALL